MKLQIIAPDEAPRGLEQGAQRLVLEAENSEERLWMLALGARIAKQTKDSPEDILASVPHEVLKPVLKEAIEAMARAVEAVEGKTLDKKLIEAMGTLIALEVSIIRYEQGGDDDHD